MAEEEKMREIEEITNRTLKEREIEAELKSLRKCNEQYIGVVSTQNSDIRSAKAETKQAKQMLAWACGLFFVYAIWTAYFIW